MPDYVGYLLAVLAAGATISSAISAFRAHTEPEVILRMFFFASLETAATAVWLGAGHGWALDWNGTLPFGCLLGWNFAMTEFAYAVCVSFLKPQELALSQRVADVVVREREVVRRQGEQQAKAAELTTDEMALAAREVTARSVVQQADKDRRAATDECVIARKDAAEANALEARLASSADSAVRCRVGRAEIDPSGGVTLTVFVENRLRSTLVRLDDVVVMPSIAFSAAFPAPAFALSDVKRTMAPTDIPAFVETSVSCTVQIPAGHMPAAFQGFIQITSVHGYCSVTGPWGTKQQVNVSTFQQWIPFNTP